jgi:enamine deaminase RidA (YjgF/YER057c/UK114 family)
MIKALSLAAALAVLPLSAAAAQEPDAAADGAASAEAAIEAAAERFEARMEEFGERAEALGADQSLTEDQRETRIAALWGEYAPDVQAFTAVVTEHAAAIAGQALAEIDVEAIVAEAMSEVDLSGAMAVGAGMARNGAWASNDPEHMATYGLMAEYALGGALDEVDAAMTEANAEIAAAAAPAAPAQPAPPAAD